MFSHIQHTLLARLAQGSRAIDTDFKLSPLGIDETLSRLLRVIFFGRQIPQNSLNNSVA